MTTADPSGIIILGGGGHARVVLSVLRANGVCVLGFTDPDESRVGSMGGAAYLGSDAALDRFDPSRTLVVNGVGSTSSTAVRARTYERATKLGLRFHQLVHSRATVAEDVVLESGAQVMAGAILQTGVKLGVNVLVNTGAIVDHDCKVGAHCHIAPGAVLSGSVALGEGAHIGTGATIRQGITVGSGAVVGAGAVVVNDVPDGCTVVGVPARPVVAVPKVKP